jgi:hypothetical protein
VSRLRDLTKRRDALLDRIRSLCGAPLMRGSIVERTRRCGRRECACATDPAARHRGLCLSVHLDGKTHAVHLRPEDVDRARAGVETYNRLWELLTRLTQCELDMLRFAAGERRRGRARRRA